MNKTRTTYILNIFLILLNIGVFIIFAIKHGATTSTDVNFIDSFVNNLLNYLICTCIVNLLLKKILTKNKLFSHVLSFIFSFTLSFFFNFSFSSLDGISIVFLIFRLLSIVMLFTNMRLEKNQQKAIYEIKKELINFQENNKEKNNG